MFYTKKIDDVIGYVEYKFDIDLSLDETSVLNSEKFDCMWERYRFTTLNELHFNLNESRYDEIRIKYGVEKVWLSAVVFEGNDEFGTKISELSVSEHVNKGHINIQILDSKNE